MERYFDDLATAFVRGRLNRPTATVADGLAVGLRLHKFKRNTELPRVQRVLDILHSIAPENLLDVGSGRGTFLWPLLSAFPHLAVTAIEMSERRAADLAAVRRGGIERLTVAKMDVHQVAFAKRSFDVVTLLEVLEHLKDPQLAVRNAVALSRRFVVLSVPSAPDNNPEHIHLFSVDQIQQMTLDAGATRTTVEHVLNHRIAILRVSA